MKIKSIKSNNRKKSFASFILALLLMFSFNSSPIIMIANNMRQTNAYKSDETKTFYSSTTGSTESNFDDGQVPSSLEKYFDGSSKNFNLYTYYNDKFAENLAKISDNLFKAWDGSFGGYTANNFDDAYTEMLEYFGGEDDDYSLLDVYENNMKDISVIKTHFTDTSAVSFQEFLEYIILNGLKDYNNKGEDNADSKSLPKFSKSFELDEGGIIGEYNRLSFFYQVLNHFTNNNGSFNNLTYTAPATNYENITAFRNGDEAYKSVKEYIEKIIVETAPIYAFDGSTQDTYIASIFANNAPKTHQYNYGDGYETYTTFIDKMSGTASTIEYTYSNAFVEGVSANVKQKYPAVYFFGSTNDTLTNSAYYKNQLINNTFDDNGPLQIVTSNNVPADLAIFYYIPIPQGEFGYIEGLTTYYKLSKNTYFEYTTSTTNYNLYVVNDNPTQSELATYDAMYMNVVSSSEISADLGKPFNERLYVNIPYESTNNEYNYYLKAVYEKLMYNIKDQKYFTFADFVSYFTQTTGSKTTTKLYLKFKEASVTQDYNKVFIASNQLNSFYDDYTYAYEIEKLPDSSIEDDYELITSASSSSSYLSATAKSGENEGKSVTISSSYKLYFKKVISYYTTGTETTYKDEYEKTNTADVKLEKDTIASSEYETTGTNNERVLYFLPADADFSGSELKISDVTISSNKITQTELDENPNYYVEVATSVYKEKDVDSSEYKLYYKHTQNTNATKIFVVDDSDNASENKIYKTLNFNVISSDELKNNYTQYLIVAEDDANYNEKFLLYYKYERTSVAGEIYILSSDAEKMSDIASYKTVGSGELTDYILIDRETDSGIYSTATNAITFTDTSIKDTYKLYYKLSDVFVQNELKKGNAIYVASKSISSSDKSTYSINLWTPILTSEVTSNSSLYVLVDSNDPNYNEDYTLYYRYSTLGAETNKIYSIEDIDQTASDFDTNAYHLINKNENGYVAGKELYYKYVVDETKDIEKTEEATNTYYYYQTSSTVTLSANSYYAVSFYVWTNNATASFVIKDTAGIMETISLNNISTDGNWQQYYAFISTDVANNSTINLYLYMGDETNGIKGNSSDDNTTVTGSVFFDDIKITKIGVTDYNKKAIDDIAVYTTPLKIDDKNQDNRYADSYNNEVFVANGLFSNVYDYKTYLNGSIQGYSIDNKIWDWNQMFDFDNIATNDELKTLLGYYISDENKGENSLNNTINADTTGYDMYDIYNADGETDTERFKTLWRYYLSRDLGYEPTDISLENYIQSYINGKLDVEITNKIEKTRVEEDDEDEDEEESKDESNDEDEEESAETKVDITYVDSPFNKNNYALKLTNKNKNIELGITSNAFKLEQFGYYKITVWIYSPDEDGTASIGINSVVPGTKAYGTLYSASVSSTYANVASSEATNAEYGWIPVTIYVEGNPYRDMPCYLVLSAGKDTTVYFDNITIEKTTSKIYDDAKSGDYACLLSLSPSTPYNNTGVTNGSFNLVTVNDTTSSIKTNDTPFVADGWTALSTNSSRVTAGILSTNKQNNFFSDSTKYPNGESNLAGIINGANSQSYENLYAIYAPSEVTALDGTTKVDFKHKYGIYSSSISLSASTTYEISFKFYKASGFTGSMVSNIYLSSVKDENLLTGFNVSNFDHQNLRSDNGWYTFTYFITTGTSSLTAYLEIGVEDATGLCYFKEVKSTKITTGETMSELMDNFISENGGLHDRTDNLYNTIINARFLDMSNMDFSYHAPSENEATGGYDNKLFTDNTTTTDEHTSGKTNVFVAYDFAPNKTKTYSVTISNVTYYIGEVYKFTHNETEYFVHKTYDTRTNSFAYKVYSDETLTTEVTKIGDNDILVEQKETSIKVTIDSSVYENTDITTTYRLYKFSDLREEVTEIDGSEVTITSLDKVVIGTGSKATENSITSTTNTSYEYRFDSSEPTSTKTDYEFNNFVIPAKELNNNQSGNVLVLANGYATDYLTLTQTSSRTIGKSSYYTLRVYAKTSNFASDDFGLNIEVEAVNTSWTNINTTKSEEQDEYGFVCYEILISSNSSDSISGFTVKLSLGSEDNLGSGYAIISKISLDSFASKDAFEHYMDVVGDDKENIKTAIYTDTASDSDEDEADADDKNSISWATFFYIFSSLLLVATTAVALVAVVIKKHHPKFAKKYANEHERDIDSIQTKKARNSKTKKQKDITIGETNDVEASRSVKDKNDTGGII